MTEYGIHTSHDFITLEYHTINAPSISLSTIYSLSSSFQRVIILGIKTTSSLPHQRPFQTYSFVFSLQSLLTPRLNGQQQHRHERSQEQRTRRIHRTRRIRLPGVDGDERRAQTSKTVEERRNAGSGAAVRRGEHFRSVRVEDAVPATHVSGGVYQDCGSACLHDVLEEGLERREDELVVGVAVEGEEVEEDAGQHRADGHSALAADVLDVDRVAGDGAAGHADDGRDDVVAVGDVRRRRAAVGARVGEVLRQEGVEERVAHADGGPHEPDERRGSAKLPAVEERADAASAELGKVALNQFDGAQLLALDDFRVAANLVENLLGQPGFGLVVVRDATDDSNGFSLPATRKEELRGFEEMEEEEARNEHAEGDGSLRNYEVAPSPVVLLGTTTLNTRLQGAGNSILSARIVGNEAPCNCGRSADARLRLDRLRVKILECQSLLRDAISCPTGHHTLSRVRRFPLANGRNSRNNAPSTGKLPPTPAPRQANSEQVATQLWPPPAARPNAPARKSVQLKARRRPMISDAIPQKLAPMHRPVKRDRVV